MRWLLTAESFGADEALAAGLVSDVVEPGSQLDRALELAERIADNAPLAVQSALASSRAAQRAGRDAAAAHLRETAADLVVSEDAAEGMAAMMERRDPDYRGM